MQLPTDALLQNLSFKKIQDNTEISGHSRQTLKFQEFQEIHDNAQACDLSCGIRIVLSQSTHLTDRQTDKQMDGQKGLCNTMHCITCSRTVKMLDDILLKML